MTQKRSERVLRESELKYRTLFETADDAILLMREDRFVDCNARALTMFGCTRDEIIGAPPYRFSPPQQPLGRDSKALALEKIGLAQSKGPQRFEWTHCRRDGTPFDAEVSLNAVDVGGDRMLQAIVHDVTERKRMESALRTNEAQLSLILNNVSDVIYAATVEPDGDYHFTSVNRRFLEITGLADRQVVGQRVQDVIPPPAHALVFGKYAEAIATRRPVHWEEVSEYPAGKRIGVVTVVPVFDAHGRCEQLVGMVHDVTERQRMEEALRASEREYRELVMLANSIILRWTRDGRITFLNEFGQKFFGYTEKEIIGRHVVGTIVPENESTGRDLKSLMGWITTDPGRFERGVNENMRRNGERVWIDWTNKVVFDERGQIREILSIGSDITDRRRAEEQVRSLNEDLRRHAEVLEQRVAERTAELKTLNAELEAFTYSVSHDLRAPLRQADGFAKILLDDYASTLDPTARHYLDRVREGTRFMGQLIDELLDFSRLGHRELALQRVGLDVVLGEARADLAAATEGRRIEWKVGPLPLAECDPILMRQVFTNLLSNGLKFTRPRDPARIEVGQVEREGQPAVFVRDNGVGFDMKYAHKLFGVFQRLHRQEDFEGTGVGLATVQRIIHKHGGRVWAEGALDHGATFYFTIRKAEAAS